MMEVLLWSSSEPQNILGHQEGLGTVTRTSMRRHILSRTTWRPPRGRVLRLLLCVSFAMLPFALFLMSPLFGDSVHCEILLFGLSGLSKALQSSDRSVLLAEGGPSSHGAVALCQIRSDRTHRSRTSRFRTAASGSSPPPPPPPLVFGFVTSASLLPLGCLAS